MSLRHSRAKYLLAVSLSPAKYLGYRNFPGNRNSPNGDAYPLFPPATVLCLCALCENGSGEEKRTRVMSHRDWYFFRILTSMKIILEFVRIGFLLISILLFLGINSIQLRVTSTLIDCLKFHKEEDYFPVSNPVVKCGELSWAMLELSSRNDIIKQSWF